MVKPIVLLGKVVFVRERLGRLIVSYSLWLTAQTVWASCDIIIASNHWRPLAFEAWVSAPYLVVPCRQSAHSNLALIGC